MTQQTWNTKVPDTLKLVRILDDGKLIVVEDPIEKVYEHCDKWMWSLDDLMEVWTRLLDRKTLAYLNSKVANTVSNTTPVANVAPVANTVVANTEPVANAVVANTDPVTPVEPVVPNSGNVVPNTTPVVDVNPSPNVADVVANVVTNVIENVISSVITPKN